MEDVKNIDGIPEIKDAELDEVSGGGGYHPQYDCQGGCGKHYFGMVPHYVGSRPYCTSCYEQYLKEHKPYERR